MLATATIPIIMLGADGKARPAPARPAAWPAWPAAADAQAAATVRAQQELAARFAGYTGPARVPAAAERGHPSPAHHHCALAFHPLALPR